MGDVGIGIVGYGMMGRAHSYAYTVAPVMRKLRHHPRLRVISGRDGHQVERAAESYGIDSSVGDWRELVNRSDVDIVDICTPPGTHAEIAIAAAAAGKAVICEKPLAVSYSEAVSAVDAVAIWRNLDVVVAGFIEPTPQQERLLAALRRRGAQIAHCDTVRDAPAERAQASAASPRDELLLALHWAREQAFANSGATVGIAVEDLAARRDEVIALAEDVLCPALQLPGIQ